MMPRFAESRRAGNNPALLLFFEHSSSYTAVSGDVPAGDYQPVPIGKAWYCAKAGNLTLIFLGRLCYLLPALRSRRRAGEKEGVEAEVIDFATLLSHL